MMENEEFDIDREIELYLNSYGKTITSADRYIIHELHSQLEYDKIVKCMTVMDWSWAFTENPITIEMIKKYALLMLVKFLVGVRETEKYNNDYFLQVEHIPYYNKSGGIEVSYYGESCFSIKFIITSWDWDLESCEMSQTYKNCLKSDDRKRKIKKILNKQKI